MRIKPVDIVEFGTNLAPLAPAIGVGFQVYRGLEGVGIVLQIIAAVSFVWAFEGTGLRAGRLRDRRWMYAYFLLGATIVLVVELWAAGGMAVIGIGALGLAVLAYLVNGEIEKLGELIDQAIADGERKQADLEFEMEQKRLDAELDRELKLKEADAKIELNLVRAADSKEVRLAKVGSGSGSGSESVPIYSDSVPSSFWVGSGRKLRTNLTEAGIRLVLNGKPKAEKARILGVTEKSIDNWQEPLATEYPEIAKEMAHE